SPPPHRATASSCFAPRVPHVHSLAGNPNEVSRPVIASWVRTVAFGTPVRLTFESKVMSTVRFVPDGFPGSIANAVTVGLTDRLTIPVATVRQADAEPDSKGGQVFTCSWFPVVI